MVEQLDLHEFSCDTSSISAKLLERIWRYDGVRMLTLWARFHSKGLHRLPFKTVEAFSRLRW